MSSAANPDLVHYRFCTPITGGAHEAYTLVGTEDNSYEITLDSDYCLIVKVTNDGDMSATGDFQLQYDVDGGGFNNVNATSSNVRSAASGDTDGATANTERLTSHSTQFIGSELDEVDALFATNLTGGVNREFYFAINFRSAELSGGETITFQLLTGGSAFPTAHDVTPTATVPAAADPNTSELPSTSLTVTTTTHTAVTTEKHLSNLASATLTLAVTTHTVETFDPNTSVLPSVSLTLAITTHTAVASDNNFAEGVSVNLTLTNNAPSAEATEHHLSQPPSAALTLAVTTHSAITTEKHIAELPSASLTLAVTTHIVESGDNDRSELPNIALTLTVTTHSAITTDKNISQLPSASLTLAVTTHSAVSTDKNISSLPSASLTLAVTTHSAVTTEDAGGSAQTDAYPLRRIPWTQQPPGPVGIDSSNPLTRGLRVAYCPWVTDAESASAFGFNAVNNEFSLQAVQAAVPFHESTAHGLADKNSGSVVATGMRISGAVVTGQNPSSMLLVLAGHNPSTNDTLWGTGSGGSGAEQRLAYSSGVIRCEFSNGGTNTAFSVVTDSVRHVVGFTNSAALGQHKDYAVWHDGAKEQLTSASSITPSGDVARFMGDPTSVGNQPALSPCLLGCAWDRELTDDEAQSFNDNPWQIFEPRRVPLLIESTAAAAAQTDVYPIRYQPCRNMPDGPRPFDGSNIFGQHCVAAIVPAWSAVHGDDSGAATTDFGSIPILNTPYVMRVREVATGANSLMYVKQVPYMGGMASSVRVEQTSGTEYLHAKTPAAESDLGMELGDVMSCIAIFRPQGDGAIGSVDPRIYCFDDGSGEQDHNLMVGSNSSNTVRTRIRTGSTTKTILAGQVQSDAWNLVSGFVFESTPGNYAVNCRSIREDGTAGVGTPSATETSGYSPTTGRDQTLWANAVGGNPFEGEILCVYFFRDNAFNDLALLRDLFADPWQVFQPDRRPLLIESAAGAPPGENNTSQLATATLTLTNNAPQVVVTEKHISQLASASLIVTANVPDAIATENNYSTLPSASLTVTANAPQAVTTEKHLSTLPSATLTLTPNAPQAVTTEGEVSLLPSAALSLTPNIPQATATEKHISTLTSADITLTAQIPSAITTEKHISQIPSASLVVTANAPQAVTTQGEVSLLPSISLTLIPNAPQAVVTEKHISQLPSASLTLAPNAPQAVTTEAAANTSQLPSASLTITANVPQAVTTEGEVSLLPSVALTLTNNAPQAVVTEKHISTLPSVNLTVTANAPQAVVT